MSESDTLDMSVEEDENVHHYDFTTASAWEIFVARLEEIIYLWKLSSSRKRSVPDDQFSKLDWKVVCEEILFADTKFLLSWHRGECNDINDQNLDVAEECMRVGRDFATTPHILSSYYGLSEFVVLDPCNISLSHSKLNTLTSAITIALNNTQCQVPHFVRALEPKQNYFVGISCNTLYRTHFDMVDLKKIPQQCQHLTGLTQIFKSNLKKICSKDLIVSIRLSYQLKNWTSYAISKDSSQIDFSNSDEINNIFKLDVGCIFEPIGSLCVRAVWSGLPDGSIVDGPGYSDLDPCRAPKWTLSIHKLEDITYSLTDHLLDFCQFCFFNGSNQDLIGDLLSKHSSSNYDKPLSSITESRIPKLSDLIFSDSMKRSFEEPIPRNLLLPILYYLFPDTEKTRKYPYQDNCDRPESIKFKTCSVDSLVWRLAHVMVHVLHSYGGPRSAAHLWHEFAQELRFRWNSSSLIPGVAHCELPDVKTCLLHQKLQMINCCIQRKLDRERAMCFNQKESDESEEEFFDAESDEYESKVSLWNLPSGRLEKHPILKLINTNNPLYIPKTQPAVPKTEDQLEEDQQALLNLGADSQASLLRAKLMSASLLSDMESFKAANPGAAIEDFIRWYSPRDWVETQNEDGTVKGELSQRMLVEDNQWTQVWTAAKPVPAHRQKRLFDETREAERALHFIESAAPAEAATLVLPVLLHASLNTLSQHIEKINSPLLTQAYEKLVKKSQTRTRNNCIDVSGYQDLITEIGTIECIISQLSSLHFKLDKTDKEEVVDKFICDLVIGDLSEVEVPGGPDGPIASKIKSMFLEAYRVDQMMDDSEERRRDVEFSHLIRADLKEFILRVRDEDVCQRLTVCLSPSRITMASLTTNSTLLI